MPTFQDLLRAKQVLSARFLRAGLRGGVVGRGPALSIHAAVANAGRNVHAVGIGKKIVEGQPTRQPCVRLYVVQKLAPSLLPPLQMLPDKLDGVPTDVIESPPAFALATRRRRAVRARAMAAAAPAACTAARKQRQRPVVAGISTAHFEVTAGTLSYFCHSTHIGDDPVKVYALSNNHVYANVNQAHPGDPLYQPGPADGGTNDDHFADFHRCVQLTLGGTVANRVDAAIGELLPGIEYQAEVCTIGAITGVDQATENMPVRKHGRTSGYTEGIVTDVSYDALVGMDHNDASVVALFENQMRIGKTDPYPAFGLGGDSGSLIVMQEDARAVGLYFAGPDDGSYGVANHIQAVLNELEIQLV
jgi:hypothetical protein